MENKRGQNHLKREVVSQLLRGPELIAQKTCCQEGDFQLQTLIQDSMRKEGGREGQREKGPKERAGREEKKREEKGRGRREGRRKSQPLLVLE